MPQIQKLIASVLLFASIFTATINLSAANSTDSNKDKTSSSQSSEIKKVLKKKLSLDYTNPKFETDLNKDQKDAILTSLKKWKGELPVDNTFTVTSINALKMETTDANSKVKKSKKETPNAQVVYMWARSINPNWPKDRIPTGEESEEGDPRFIRTEFNVLLKQNKNGKYKASIERDVEVKTESLDISENSLDDQIYQDLFATNKVDSAFTATTGILIEPGETATSISSTTISSLVVNSVSVSSTSTSNSQSTISNLISSNINVSSINLSSFQSSNSTSSKTISFLEGLLNFGSIRASAGENDYSWPWRNGEVWRNGQSWHQCETIYNNFATYGCSLDFQPHYTNASFDILAPISGTIRKACDDGTQGYMQVGDNMAILHMASNTLVYNSIPGVYVTKSTKIGTMYPNAIPENTIINQCGSSNGKHIHIKLAPITETYPNSGVFQGSMPAIDGVTITGQNNYKTNFYSNGTALPLYISQNTPPPVIFNNNPGTIDLVGVSDTWSLDVENYGTANGTRVNMNKRTTSANNAQKWQYYPSTKEIKGINDLCLDSGNSNDGDFLRINSCTGNNNQKWNWNTNKTISDSQSGRCIQYEGLYPGGSAWQAIMRNCTGGGQQTFKGNGMNIPQAITDPNINTVLPPQAAWQWAMDNRCGATDVTQVVMKLRDNGNCQKMRYNSGNNTITNAYGKCLDAGNVNSSSDNWLRFSNCHYGSNQKWKQQAQNLGGQIWSFEKNSNNQNMCIQYQSLTDQYGLNVVACDSNNQNQKWYPDLQITQESFPSATSTVVLNTYGYNYCLAIANPTNDVNIPIKLKACNTVDIEQQWEVLQSNTGGKMYRRKGTTKCLGKYFATTQSYPYMWECDANASNQAWNYNSGDKLIYQVQTSSQCLAVLSYSVGTNLQTFVCNSGDSRFWWNPISI